MITRRALVAAFSVPFLANPARAAPRVFTPEAFGAHGDGRTDDSAAFARLSDAVNASSGGTIVLRRTTYLVGSDGIVPARLIDLAGCSRPIRIDGNGARLRCRDGAHYGAEVPRAKDRKERRNAKLFRPYEAMIRITGCSGSIDIADVELDGNADALIAGERRGDHGWQIACAGLFLRENAGAERVTRVHAHHHPWDGVYLDGVNRDTPGVERLFTDVRCDANGRQGMSIVGGRGYVFQRCSFTRTGHGHIRSAPAAGVDIEAEHGKSVRNLRFADCRFEDNDGAGLLAQSGDSAAMRFDRCTFVGVTNYSAWPKKPGMVFTACTFVGTLINCFGDPDPALAARFVDCLLTDDPARSSTGVVYLRKSFIADLAHGRGGLTFERCRILLTHAGVLPWSTGVRWIDCVMSQRSTTTANTRGTFLGTNRITGPVALHGSTIAGTLIFNGRTVPRTAPPAPKPS